MKFSQPILITQPGLEIVVSTAKHSVGGGSNIRKPRVGILRGRLDERAALQKTGDDAGFQGLYLQTLSVKRFQGLYLQTLSSKCPAFLSRASSSRLREGGSRVTARGSRVTNHESQVTALFLSIGTLCKRKSR